MLNRDSTAIPHNHALSFYDDDTELVAEVAAFVVAGLAAGEHVIVVATARHQSLFAAALTRASGDLGAARSQGRLVTLDARQLLSSFMHDGMLHPSEFEARVGALVDAAAGGSPVRIFGEMVALLWEDGNVTAAIELEALWNALASEREFSLRCAYGLPKVSGSALEDVHKVCQLHSTMRPPSAYAPGGPRRLDSFAEASSGSHVFFCLPAAVPAVRRFVALVLGDWGQDELIPDAILVASELATNAVRHARTPFRVCVDRSRSRVRISVEDVDRLHPAVCATAGEATSGRGVLIVDDVCGAWGSDQLPRGKVVWGDLSISLRVSESVPAAS